MIFCFIHIPRSGGTTLMNYFQHGETFNYKYFEDYGPERPWLDINDPHVGFHDEWFKEIAKKYRKEFSSSDNFFIGGHFPVGLHKFTPKDTPFQYITLLRNPIDRVWSRFQAYMMAHDHKSYTILSERYNFDLISAMEAGEPEFCNDATRLLSGTNEVFLTDSHFQQAKNNLEQMIVSPLINIKNYLRKLHERYPKDFRPTIISLAYNRIIYVEMNKRIRDAIKKYNTMDMELYNSYRE